MVVENNGKNVMQLRNCKPDVTTGSQTEIYDVRDIYLVRALTSNFCQKKITFSFNKKCQNIKLYFVKCCFRSQKKHEVRVQNHKAFEGSFFVYNFSIAFAK